MIKVQCIYKDEILSTARLPSVPNKGDTILFYQAKYKVLFAEFHISSNIEDSEIVTVYLTK